MEFAGSPDGLVHGARWSRMVVDLLSLLVVLTLGLLTPGPDFLLVLKNSVGGSRVKAFATVAGVTGGLLVQMVTISVGFTALSPGVLRWVQLAGAGFLALIGARALLSAPREDVEGPVKSAGRSAFLEGLTCNLTNPKAFLFYVSLFAQVLPHSASVWHELLPVLFVVHGAIAWSCVVLAVQSPPVARRLVRAQRWLPRLFGVVLLAFAGWVAWQAW